jgi:hypothetical protein
MRHRNVVPLGVLSGALAFALLAQASSADVSVSPIAQVTPAPGAPAGLVVKPVAGSEALAVSGTAPAGRALQLTLYATFSRDIPDTLITRQTILPGPDGTFAVTVPTAPAFLRGAVLTVVVGAPPSGPFASARVTVGAPNVTVPPDNLPYNVR